MNHLIISREYPPAAYPAGGIGAYVANSARLLAERGETVHVIGQRWKGAPLVRETGCNERIIIHRIATDDPVEVDRLGQKRRVRREIDALRATEFPDQWFAWHAAFLIVRLIDQESIEVIEGQDWEAPLYYLLLRRALGMGPERRPPCVVHLHSPTEFIARFNGLATNWQPYLPMKRMEEFCIRAADALLCPSRYLAQQCAAHYGLPAERIKIVPYPVGFVSLVERNPDVWARGSVCFVGRLEARKGIIEWIEAATRVAAEGSDAEFDFVGADICGLQSTLISHIPRALRSRFRFHGPKPRDELFGVLAGARAAVVPSRWENFPNVCIEAMGSGLPVIATRFGGMAEMVEDGRTGWLAPDTGVSGMVDGLAEVLRRCLATSPAELVAMGRRAAEAVGRLCNNEGTVNEQIAWRLALGRSGACRSLRLVSSPFRWSATGPERVVAMADSGGAGIVVRVEVPSDAGRTIASLCSQTVRPRAVALVHSRPGSPEENAPSSGPDKDILSLYCPDRTGADAWNAGFEALQARGKCGFWVFLDGYDILLPDYICRVEKVFAHRPELGILSVWTERTTGAPATEAPLCPEPQYQLRANEVTRASAFRAEAMGEHAPFRRGMPAEYDIYDLANAVMAKAWQAAAYPEILAERRVKQEKIAGPRSTALRAMRAEVLSRFSDVLSPVTLALVDEYVPNPLEASDADLPVYRRVARRMRGYVRIIVREPRRALRGVMRRAGVVLAFLGSRFGPGKTQTVE